jgi:hypothetical protein
MTTLFLLKVVTARIPSQQHFSWGEKLPRLKAYRMYGTSQDYKDETTPPQS